MIQPQTLLNVADNSGARKLMCIRVIGAAGNQRYARIGDVIVAVIKDALPQMPLERSEVIRAVIVRTCKEFKCEDGIIIRYDDNAAVIIDQKGNPKGTRVFGAIAEELRELKHNIRWTKYKLARMEAAIETELMAGQETPELLASMLIRQNMRSKLKEKFISHEVMLNNLSVQRESEREKATSQLFIEQSQSTTPIYYSLLPQAKRHPRVAQKYTRPLHSLDI